MNGELISKYSGKSILAVGAYPDDLETGVGGTLARLGRTGARVLMVVVCVPSKLPQRRREAAAAAGILGCELIILFPEKCRRVEDVKTYELVRLLDRLVEERRPAAVVAHGQSQCHRDHVLVHHACLAAQRIGYHDFFCYHSPDGRPVQFPFAPQAFVDISDTIEDKLKAIGAHATQFPGPGPATDRCRETARACGRLAGVEYAEALEVVRMTLS